MAAPKTGRSLSALSEKLSPEVVRVVDVKPKTMLHTQRVRVVETFRMNPVRLISSGLASGAGSVFSLVDMMRTYEPLRWRCVVPLELRSKCDGEVSAL